MRRLAYFKLVNLSGGLAGILIALSSLTYEGGFRTDLLVPFFCIGLIALVAQVLCGSAVGGALAMICASVTGLPVWGMAVYAAVSCIGWVICIFADRCPHCKSFMGGWHRWVPIKYCPYCNGHFDDERLGFVASNGNKESANRQGKQISDRK